MQAGEARPDPATVVITHKVFAGNQAAYEKWLDEIGTACKASPGHINKTIIAPVRGVTDAYTVIIRFDTRDNLIGWMESDARKALVEKVRPLLVDDDKFIVKSGLDFWFTPEGAQAKLPTRWKQFLITWSAIYPLVLLVPPVWAPVFEYFHIAHLHYFKALFVTLTIVGLMVYLVMPNYTRLVHKWLFR